MTMNKAYLSHIVAIGLTVLGYFTHIPIIYNTGLFAVAGSLTNEIAIYMLFEKVPFLYGSGVIPNRFEEFKQGIYDLIMLQFFNAENLGRFFDEHEHAPLVFEGMIEHLDLSRTFDAFVSVILNSSMGGMLGMIGGAKMLESFREPFIVKLKEEMILISQGEAFQAEVQKQMRAAMNTELVHRKVSEIVMLRLNELTPRMVKDIIADMIKKHLGWLVVWGAVFGGLLGAIATLVDLTRVTH